ncbi:MAG: GntR family transcriptional regulator [Desulfobacterales bacterium]|nr:GntR family transcriptional regulator [Desulfobacterales bacterium]
MFQTAKPTKVFQEVVAQIEEAILAGRIETGQTLPSERELKEMFQISRGTLREALRVLEQKGLIEIRLGVGGGSVVRAVDAGRVSESLGLLIRSQKVSLQPPGRIPRGGGGQHCRAGGRAALRGRHPQAERPAGRAPAPACRPAGGGATNSSRRTSRST